MPGKPLEDFVKGVKPPYLDEMKAIRKAQKKGKVGVSKAIGSMEVLGETWSFDTILMKSDWGGKKPRWEDVYSCLQADVHISWTDTRECTNVHDCCALLRELQQEHMDYGERDIKHNFLIGGDGNVYEGRGWHSKPPKCTFYPDIANCSINIAHIGKKGMFPPRERAKRAFELVEYGKSHNCLQDFVGVFVEYFPDPQPMTQELKDFFQNDEPPDGPPSEWMDGIIY